MRRGSGGGKFPAMCNTRALSVVVVFSALVVLQCGVIAQVSAQGSNTATSRWQTLSGNPPFVVAQGGFSGLFPDSSSAAYNLALITSVPDVIFWCDVQLTKDGVGICFPHVNLQNGSNVPIVFKKQQKTYLVDGVPTPGWFSIDYTLNELSNAILTQGVYSRTNKFDGSLFQILTVEDVATQFKPPGLWLNIQHDMFYTQHNLSMRSFVLSVSRKVIVSYISSPEVNFLRGIAARFPPSITKLVFRFLGQTEIEPTTNQTYGSLLKNLTFIKTFASGILVPKDYIWPLDVSQYYLLPHTSVVMDAHKEGLEVFASGFSNDLPISFNYSYDPLAEYLSFIDNGDFSVDGVLSEFPITPSEAIDCFSHLGKNASKPVDLLVISKFGASGDYPGCTDLAYQKAISDGVDIIDCPVQMSKDGVPFCLSSINLVNSTLVAQSSFSNLTTSVPDIMAGSGIFSFSLTWDDIQTLTPQISNSFATYKLFRNLKYKNAGKFMQLSDFLDMAKNASSLSGVLIGIQNAAYLAQNQGMSITDAVMDALGKAGYNNQTALKVMIRSADSSVLKKFKEKNKYELVYDVEENIRDALNSTIEDIKKFADSLVITKKSVFPENAAFVTGSTNLVSTLQSFKLPVYVETFSNEFVSQAWDFFSDATVEINSYFMGAGINGVITDFPMTSARYRKNRCLNLGDKTPAYMSPVQPGSLVQLVTSPYMPPAEAPMPVLTVSDVIEPPLPPVSPVPPTSPGNGSVAPSTHPNGQPKVAEGVFLSSMAMLVVILLLL